MKQRSVHGLIAFHAYYAKRKRAHTQTDTDRQRERGISKLSVRVLQSNADITNEHIIAAILNHGGGHMTYGRRDGGLISNNHF